METIVCTAHIPLVAPRHQVLHLHESYLEHLDQLGGHWVRLDSLVLFLRLTPCAVTVLLLDVVVFARIYLLGRFLRNKLGYNVASHDVRFIGKHIKAPSSHSNRLISD